MPCAATQPFGILIHQTFDVEEGSSCFQEDAASSWETRLAGDVVKKVELTG